MSLKMFHLLFISVAVLLALFCAAVAVQTMRDGVSGTGFAVLAACTAAAVTLVRYEAGFLRRCQERGIR